MRIKDINNLTDISELHLCLSRSEAAELVDSISSLLLDDAYGQQEHIASDDLCRKVVVSLSAPEPDDESFRISI